MDTEHTSSTISRREILKRGAFVGGAVLWVTPVVQAVGMGRAYAKDVSPNCTRYCIKWDATDNQPLVPEQTTCTLNGTISAYPIWGNTWTGLGTPPAGTANALTCPADGVDNDTSAQTFTNRTGREFVVYGTQLAGFWIAFPADTKLAYLADVGLASVGAKCGTTTVTFPSTVEDDPCFKDPNNVPFKRIRVVGCGNGKDVSHIEMIVDWCPNGQPQ